MIIVLLILVALLAYANGSNDNSKGVATLVGFGAATPGKAMLYATITTALGAVVSCWFSQGLLKSFSTGLFAAGTPLTHSFFAAVLIGAFGWVIFASFTGLPVSTTHAIIGSLIGAGLVAFGGYSVQWHVLAKIFVMPLLVSPLLSLLIVYAVAWPVVWGVKRYAAWCVCVTQPVAEPAMALASTAVAAPAAAPALMVGADAECAAENPLVVVSTSAAANAVHWFSSGMIGFARGWNDAPKIAALGLIALPKSTGLAFTIVTVAMAVGGLASGRKVLGTLARKLTPLPLAESLTASLTTASLVCLASWNGLPVSTTHVATGSIIGAGLKRDARGVKWGKVGEIAVSWVVTLPAAGLLAAGAKWVLR